MGIHESLQYRKPISRIVALLVLAGGVIVLSLPWCRQVFASAGSQVIVQGVSIPGLALGGMTAQDAIDAVRKWADASANHVVVAQLGDRKWKLTPKQVTWRVDAESVVAEAIAVGRKGPIWQRWLTRWKAAWSGVSIYPASEASARATRVWLEKLEAEIYQPPSNAYRDLETSVIVKEKQGRKLDIDASAACIQAALAGRVDAVDLVTQTIQPRIVYDDVTRTHTPVAIARFSTNFNAAVHNRVANIRMAAAMINGIILAPGETFSFNEIVGPRLVATGYREAPELLKGDLVPGIGGGVCQVSSTLYNAVLLSNLRVLQRYKHSAALGYVAAGRDATVSYGLLDFRFQNNLDYPIVVRTFVEKSRVSVSLWGKAELPYQVQLLSETRTLPVQTIERSDPSLPQGRRVVLEEGKPGQLVIISKVVKSKNGGASPKQVVSKNLYVASPRVISVGVSQAAKVPQNTHMPVQQPSTPQTQAAPPEQLAQPGQSTVPATEVPDVNKTPANVNTGESAGVGSIGGNIDQPAVVDALNPAPNMAEQL